MGACFPADYKFGNDSIVNNVCIDMKYSCNITILQFTLFHGKEVNNNLVLFIPKYL